MPSILVYTNLLTPGNCQMPIYTVGDSQNWSLQFNNGSNFYNPAGVSMSIGFVRGLGDLTFGSAFQWVDRMNNQHTGSFAIAAGLPGSLTWDETPIGISGASGAWLLRGRVPPSGTIRKVYVKYGGTGTTTVPAVRFNGGANETGQAATATATVGAGDVTAITVINGGRGYSSTNPPEVIITGDGTGAIWKVTTITSGAIVTISKVTAGTGYTTATVTIRDAEATAVAAVGGTSAVTGLTLINQGSGYTTAPAIAITGGGGASATATAALANATWGLSGFTITNAGTLYTAAPTLSLSGGTGSGASGTVQISPYGVILSVTLTNPGNGRYDAVPRSVSFSGGGGSGATGQTILQANSFGYYDIIGIAVLTGGSGYISAPTVVIDQGTGSGATGTAVVGTGAITSITLTSPGSGYGSTAPAVTITAPGGGGVTATATAQLIGSPLSPVITITAGGSGYTSPPSAAFSGGAGMGASAVCLISLGITSVTITQGGYAYTNLPALSILPNNGAVLIPAGIESHSAPFLQNLNPATAQGAITVTPFTNGRRDASGNLIYDDSLLIIRPRYLIQPTLTLQPDGLTWAAVFTPVTTMVQAVLNYRRSFIADVQIFGAGRLLFTGAITIAAA